MGWGGSSGQLGHSGGAGYGAAHVDMFTEDSSNVDLREVHVAVATNIGFPGYDLPLMSVGSVGRLVNKGRNLVIVALVGTKLHNRVFEAKGNKVGEKEEKGLINGEKKMAPKKGLNKGLDPLPEGKKKKKKKIKPG